jgi:hypothetical protein
MTLRNWWGSVKTWMAKWPRPIDLDRQVETTQNMQPIIFNQEWFGDAKGTELGIYLGHWNATHHIRFVIFQLPSQTQN